MSIDEKIFIVQNEVMNWRSMVIKVINLRHSKALHIGLDVCGASSTNAVTWQKSIANGISTLIL